MVYEALIDDEHVKVLPQVREVLGVCGKPLQPIWVDDVHLVREVSEALQPILAVAHHDVDVCELRPRFLLPGPDVVHRPYGRYDQRTTD